MKNYQTTEAAREPTDIRRPHVATIAITRTHVDFVELTEGETHDYETIGMQIDAALNRAVESRQTVTEITLHMNQDHWTKVLQAARDTGSTSQSTTRAKFD